MAYKVLRFDASGTTDRVQLLNPNDAFTALHVLQVPSGAAPELSIGEGERFPVFAGFFSEFCPAERAGLSLRSLVATPGEIIILAWFDGGASGGPN